MNPLTNVKNIEKLSKQQLTSGNSWHRQYKDSAWIFVGGLQYDLTEGDIVCVFSQFGEVVNINLIRDKKSGKSKGYAFLCYEDQRSTILATDNMNGITLAGRIIRVDHVEDYRVPRITEDMDPERKKLALEGCAPLPVMEEVEPDIKVLDVEEDVKKEKEHKKHKRKHSESSSKDEHHKKKKKKKHKKK